MRKLLYLSAVALFGTLWFNAPASAWSEQDCINACRSSTSQVDYCIRIKHRCVQYRTGRTEGQKGVKRVVNDYFKRQRGQ